MTESPRPPRVVLMLDQLAPGGGGAEVFTVGLAVEMAGRGLDVRLCTTRQAEGFLLDRIHAAGIPHLDLGRRGRFDLGPFISLWRYLRRERIDILHSHMFGSNLWGTIVGRLARTRVLVAHEHTWSYEGQRVRKLLDGYFIGRLVDAFVAVSSADRARMVLLESVPRARTVVIPAAYVPREETPPNDVRRELGIDASAPVVGVVAVLRAQKALTVLIDAIVLLRERLPDVRLVVVGDGPCRAPWQDYAREHGLGDSAVFTGLRADAAALTASFDVAALSSDFEGTPLFVMECMARGTPFVGTDVGGMRDIVEPGQSALLVPRRDPAALAGALERVLTEPGLSARLAAGGSEAVGELTIDRVSVRIEELYARLLEGGTPEP